MTTPTTNTGIRPMNMTSSNTVSNGWTLCPEFESDSKYSEKLSRLQEQMERKLFVNPRSDNQGRLDTHIIDDLGKALHLRQDYPGQIADYAVIRSIFQALQSPVRMRRDLANAYVKIIMQDLSRQKNNYPAMPLVQYYCNHHLGRLINDERRNSTESDRKLLREVLASVPHPIIQIARTYCLRQLSLDGRQKFSVLEMEKLLAGCMNEILQKKRLQKLNPVCNTMTTRNNQVHNNNPQPLSVPFPTLSIHRQSVPQQREPQRLDRRQCIDFGIVKSKLVSNGSYTQLSAALYEEFFRKEKDIDTMRVKIIGQASSNLESDFLILDCILRIYASGSDKQALRACELLKTMIEDWDDSAFLRLTLPFLGDYFSWRIDVVLQPSGKLNSDLEPENLSDRLGNWSECDMWCATHLAHDRMQQLNSPQSSVFEACSELLGLPPRRTNGVIRMKELVDLLGKRENELRKSIEKQSNTREEETNNSGNSLSLTHQPRERTLQPDNNNQNQTRSSRKRTLENEMTSQPTSRQRVMENDMEIKQGTFFDFASDDERSSPINSHIRPEQKPFNKNKPEQSPESPEKKRSD